MPDPNQNQDQDQPQLTPSDLAELHGIAWQLQSAGDPRAAKLWSFIEAQSGGGEADSLPNFTLRQSSPQFTSWQEDLENELWGGNIGAEGDLAAQGADESGSAAAVSSGDRGAAELEGEAAGKGQQEQVPDDALNAVSAATGDAGRTDEADPTEGFDLEQGRYTPASADDIANGSYIKVGFRYLLKGPKVPRHTYIQIPMMGQDGKPVPDEDGRDQVEYWGVLGNEGSSKNQQVRNDKDRNSQVPGYEGKEVYVKVTPEQREAPSQRHEVLLTAG